MSGVCQQECSDRDFKLKVSELLAKHADLLLPKNNVAISARLMEGEVGGENVEDAGRAALMHEFVRDLPLEYETILGGGVGVGLSGGQKQRLSIARAKLRNPTVLILGKIYSFFCSRFASTDYYLN